MALPLLVSGQYDGVTTGSIRVIYDVFSPGSIRAIFPLFVSGVG